MEYSKLYGKAYKYCAINNGDGIEKDPDLHPVIIRLPDPPKDLTKIKNYGLHPDDQVYVRDKLPVKLVRLEDEVMDDLQKKSEKANNAINGFKITNGFWKLLDERKTEMKDEIEFIKMVQWKRVYGEWVYINGRPIWIPPWHYALLNWWYMSGVDGNDGYPEFRIRDWKSYVYKHYLYTTTETFAHLDDKGYAVKGEDGKYEMIDVGFRLFYGDIQPKNRRSGATHQGLCGEHEIITHGRDRHGTLISKSTTDVRDHFSKKFIPAWKKLPIFMKPIWNGNNEPASYIEYKTPSNVYGHKSLGSSLFITESTSETVVDSMTLSAILLDEQGKATGGGRVDVSSRWRITKQTLSTGSGTKIRGFAFNPSTAEEMDDGAKFYFSMCEGSDFYQRNEIGQTKSGLALTYFPAQYCLEGFVDKFGFPVVDKPTEKQKKMSPSALFTKHNIGSRGYLLAQRDAYLKEKSPTASRIYREEIRKQPMRYAESWMGGGGEIGFPMEEIDRRLSIARLSGEKWVRDGEFYRDGGKDGRVYWRDVPDGKFQLSYKMDDSMTNQIAHKFMYDVNQGMKVRQFAPVSPKIILGADPFAFENRQKSKLREGNISKSDGGIGAYYPFDSVVDGNKENSDDWESDRCVLTYRYRPESQDEYFEDVIMACQYLNAMCYPENNVKDLYKYFLARGYGGYLKFNVNPLTGKPLETPGYNVNDNTKKEMFNKVNDYLVRNAHRERHVKLLEECKKIRSTDELNHYDLLAAFGAALHGSDGIAVSQQAQERQINLLEAYSRLNLG